MWSYLQIMSCITIDYLSKWGDFIGGIFGTIVSVFVAIYVFKTFHDTRKQANKQQFESIYYKMLETFYQLGKDISGSYDNTEYIGDVFFKKYVSLLDQYYTYEPYRIGNYAITYGNEKLDDFINRRVIPIMTEDNGLNLELPLKERINA